MEKKKRGFAVIDPEKVREIARKGGRAAHEPGRIKRAHEFTPEEAAAAGRKGGLAAAAARRARKASEAGNQGSESVGTSD